MSYSSIGQFGAIEPGVWAQVAECVADGGEWDGFKCVKLGTQSWEERACKASGGDWNFLEQKCYSTGPDSGDDSSGTTSTTTGGGGGSGGSSKSSSKITWGQIGLAAAALVGIGWYLKGRKKK